MKLLHQTRKDPIMDPQIQELAGFGLKGQELNHDSLFSLAKKFCKEQSLINHETLIGVTDGKAVGSYVEHRFQEALVETFGEIEVGNSARGIDIPDPRVMTDIKVTSIRQPQSSCPYTEAGQKIFGLGFNLLLFVYEKNDTPTECRLRFTNCAFISKDRSADFTMTKRLIEMVNDGANVEDIQAYLFDRNIPGDDIALRSLAEKVIDNPPKQGYLNISNALQLRLQYGRVITLENTVEGIDNFDA